MNAEGWYEDPYRIHQDRWFSDGQPTALVRDGDTESNDPPPDYPPPNPLVASDHATINNGEDLLRSDEEPPLTRAEIFTKVADAEVIHHA